MASTIHDRALKVRSDDRGLFVRFENEDFRPPADYRHPRNLNADAIVKEYRELSQGDTVRCHRSRGDIVVFHFDAANEAQGNYLVWRTTPGMVVDRELFAMLHPGRSFPEPEEGEPDAPEAEPFFRPLR